MKFAEFLFSFKSFAIYSTSFPALLFYDLILIFVVYQSFKSIKMYKVLTDVNSID